MKESEMFKLQLETVQEMKAITKELSELINVIKADRKTELSVAEAATYLGLEKKTVYNLVNRGELVGFKRRKFRLFYKSELDEFKNKL